MGERWKELVHSILAKSAVFRGFLETARRWSYFKYSILIHFTCSIPSIPVQFNNFSLGTPTLSHPTLRRLVRFHRWRLGTRTWAGAKFTKWSRSSTRLLLFLWNILTEKTGIWSNDTDPFPTRPVKEIAIFKVQFVVFLEKLDCESMYHFDKRPPHLTARYRYW